MLGGNRVFLAPETRRGKMREEIENQESYKRHDLSSDRSLSINQLSNLQSLPTSLNLPTFFNRFPHSPKPPSK